MDLEKDIPRAYSTDDPTSFAFTSAQNRWPSILTNAIDDCARALYNVSPSAENDRKIQEGKGIIRTLGELKYELQHNRELSPLPEDAGEDIRAYNEELAARGNPTWHNCQWLFAECYLYRRIATIFCQSTQWKSYDVFDRLKMSTFKSSRPAVIELAARYREIFERLQRSDAPIETTDEKKKEDAERLLFTEMCEICLWGNATDLSLLTTLSYDDIQKLQGSNARKESEKNILANDLRKAFDVLSRLKKTGQTSRRVDIVLDNAGFELYVDLILAGYLLATGLATQVVLHPKNIPWFVSDVVLADFDALLSALKQPRDFFADDRDQESVPTSAPKHLQDDEEANLQFCHNDWSTANAERKLSLRSDAFWTHGGSFWRMPQTAPDLFESLKGSELVIFKGDLNYRKMTGDVSSPFLTFDFSIGLWRDQTTDRPRRTGLLGSDDTILHRHRPRHVRQYTCPRAQNLQSGRCSRITTRPRRAFEAADRSRWSP